VIDVENLKVQLSSLPLRHARKQEAEEWGTGHLPGIPDHLLPEVSKAVRDALVRIARQCQSIGPRIVNIKRFGTLGDVNWGGENTTVDAILREQDLDAIAEELLENAYYSGLIAGIVRRDPETSEIRIEPLVGHVEPVFSRTSPTRVAGILHTWVEPDSSQSGTSKWTVRLYDLAERVMREWTGLNAPSAMTRNDPTTIVEPSAEYPAGAPMPRFVFTGRDSERMPMGELATLLPLLQSDWSSQVRGDRIEESTAIPQLVVKGEAEDGTDERSSTHVIRLIDDGDAKYIIPGDLTSLHNHHDRKLERIREDANLPGGFLGNQTPSGEALQEANAKFVSSNRWYAARLSRVLTELVADLLVALGMESDAPQVTVSINREFTKNQEIRNAIDLYREGLTSLEAAVRHISVFMPTWSDDEVEAFISAEAEAMNPQPVVPGQLEPVDDEVPA